MLINNKMSCNNFCGLDNNQMNSYGGLMADMSSGAPPQPGVKCTYPSNQTLPLYFPASANYNTLTNPRKGNQRGQPMGNSAPSSGHDCDGYFNITDAYGKGAECCKTQYVKKFSGDALNADGSVKANQCGMVPGHPNTPLCQNNFYY